MRPGGQAVEDPDMGDKKKMTITPKKSQVRIRTMPPGTDRRGSTRRFGQLQCEVRRPGEHFGVPAILAESSEHALFLHTAHTAESGEWVVIQLSGGLEVNGSVIRRDRSRSASVAVAISSASRLGSAVDPSGALEALLAR